ncbi:hypothetical protein LZF95_20100 [Algoriphagus sp. AGSA1]|uniref:hypothetical protein n=1 Tax=Algoriphagus sp. AGSA1 TaxID=2907213 RepID=UPI001F19ABCE|nr:hypothetical protein [Algoriphagus sp. AGSA1]MCE7056993.1 hypothetical protein [Algoriphagus sp. AGSA1]
MKALVTLLVLITGVMVSSCQESEDPLEPGATVSLNRIPENPAYTSLPLMGTQWKLLGFADEKTGKIRLVEPYSDDNFILVFGESGTITGMTSTNEAYGEYSMSNNQLLISSFGNATEINELFDGPLYIETMNKVVTFKMSPKGLHLFYDEEKFLLFQQAE